MDNNKKFEHDLLVSTCSRYNMFKKHPYVSLKLADVFAASLAKSTTG